MRQLLYISSSYPRGSQADLPTILTQSRHNNAIDGVTGLLWSDGVRFLQVLEGPEESVAATFERIRGDPRHHAIVVLQERAVEQREFGGWSMAHRTADASADAFDAEMRRLLERTTDDVRGTFLGLIVARSA